MSTSSSKEVMLKVDNIIQSRSFPIWVDSFLEKIFFEKCLSHDSQKNELNRYCINCDASICRYCIAHGAHRNHRILTIYRHVYQNVVPLSEMEMHINCDRIQPYKCNKKWVVSLNPLPHNGSGSLIEGDGACNICKRKLTDPDRFRFCSITCKEGACPNFPIRTSGHCNPRIYQSACGVEKGCLIGRLLSNGSPSFLDENLSFA